MINGGWLVLQLLDLHKKSCFSRPSLNTLDWLLLTWNAMWKKGIETQREPRIDTNTAS